MQSKPKTIIITTLKILLVVLAILGLTGLMIIWETGEPPKREMVISNLNGTITVYRDDRGVPHILAENLNDLFFVQGYLYAQDRGWQLELVRRIINGELSELAPTFGSDSSVINAFYKTDLFLKQIGLKRNAEALIKFISPELRSYMQSYVDGLNYYIRNHGDNLPVELKLLNLLNNMELRMHEWDVADSLAVQGYMGLALSLHGATTDLLRRDFALKIGLEATDFLMPLHHHGAREWFFNLTKDNLLPPDYISSQSLHDLHYNNISPEKFLPEPLVELIGETIGHGSNNWVVGPNKTENGYPILANDMHLDLTTPGIWYEIHMYAPGYHVWGWSLPGAPMIVAGHNDYVQWGFTNTMADVADLYYLKMTADGTGYYIKDQIKKFEIVKDQIKLSNGTIKNIEIKISEFGPLIEFGNMTYAFQWPMEYAIPENNIFEAIYNMNTAKNAIQFREALKTFSFPGQNVVFADIYGEFGYQYTGLIPIRSNGYGIIPLDGSSGLYNWTGFIPFNDLYHVMNPSQGYFASANQYLVPENYTYYLSGSYAPSYRADRINQLLSSKDKLSIDDIKTIQQDTYFIPRTTFQSLLAMLPRENLTAEETTVLDYALSWNGFANRSDMKAPAFFAWLGYFTYNTLYDDLGPDLFFSAVAWNYFDMLSTMLKNSYSYPLFDNNTTPQIETAIDIALESIKNATSFLYTTLGGNPLLWSWGAIHKAKFGHFLGDAFNFLNPSLIDADGAQYTVKPGTAPFWKYDDKLGAYLDFTQTMGSSERVITLVQPGFHEVYVVTPPGELGQLNSGHYSDQLAYWAEGNYYRTFFDINYVKANYSLQTTFKPA